MPITSYTELKAAIANWQHRTVGSFTARIPEFVALFEASANATLRLRENEIETGLTATPSSSFIALPADHQAPVSLKLAATPRRLVFKTPDRLPWHPSPGPSERWTVKDSRLQTERDADQAYAYTFRYHRTFALSETAVTNALLARYPNLYLYGSLLEAAPYVRDLGLIGLWQARYDRASGELERAEAAQKKNATLGVDPALMAHESPFSIVEG